MLDRARYRYLLSRHRILGLAAIFLVVTGTVSARAADQIEPHTLLASRYSGSDLSGGQSAWPPRGVPRTRVNKPLPYGDDDSVPIPAAPGGVTLAAQNPRADQPSLAGILSEIRVGVLAHDIGLFQSNREDGADLSVEVFFVSPRIFEAIWSPRPHIGIAANTAGDTSQIYGGLAWDWTFREPFFVELTLALAIHDGELDNRKPDRQALGCRVLLRESVSLGARFLERHSISLQFAHISNATLCRDNTGLDTIGVQYGYRF